MQQVSSSRSKLLIATAAVVRSADSQFVSAVLGGAIMAILQLVPQKNNLEQFRTKQNISVFSNPSLSNPSLARVGCIFVQGAIGYRVFYGTFSRMKRLIGSMESNEVCYVRYTHVLSWETMNSYVCSSEPWNATRYAMFGVHMFCQTKQ